MPRVQNQVPWATAWSAALGYSINDEVLRCRLLSKNLFQKVSVVHNSCFKMQVSHFYS